MSAQAYRRYAAECQEMSLAVADPEARALLKRMAIAWTDLADQPESSPRTPKNLDMDPERFVPLAERECHIFASILEPRCAQFYCAVFFSPDLGSGLRPLINGSRSLVVRRLAAVSDGSCARGCHGGVAAFQLNLVRDAPFKLSQQLHRGGIRHKAGDPMTGWCVRCGAARMSFLLPKVPDQVWK
jgi:hypothetical protein